MCRPVNSIVSCTFCSFDWFRKVTQRTSYLYPSDAAPCSRCTEVSFSDTGRRVGATLYSVSSSSLKSMYHKLAIIHPPFCTLLWLFTHLVLIIHSLVCVDHTPPCKCGVKDKLDSTFTTV